MEVYASARDEILEIATQPLAAGGEGRVFAVRGHPTLLAKLFEHPAADHRREKLVCLITHPFQHDPPETDGFRRFAMPEDLLFDARDKTQFLGGLIPRIPKTSAALHEYFDPGGSRYRRDRLPLRRALAIAVAELVADAHAHHLMLVLGDINPNNILADDFGRASLIDLDSCQLTTNLHGRTYHCTVGSNPYKAPELYGKDLRTYRREPSTDLFGLAVLIWQLVTEGGKHPFAAANDPDLIGRIRRGDFPYVPGSPHPPPPDALPRPSITSVTTSATPGRGTAATTARRSTYSSRNLSTANRAAKTRKYMFTASY